MANTIFEHAFTGNDEIKLANKMNFETLKRTFWNKWLGYTSNEGRMVRVGNGVLPMTTSAPVVVHRELISQGGDVLKVPMLRKLDNLPKFGNSQLKGFEEKQAVSWMYCAVDNVRHAVLQQEGAMSAQTTKGMKLLENSKPQLSNHFARWLNANLTYAMYSGHSYNILVGSGRYASHSKIEVISHPHFFTAGAGKVSYSAGNPSTAGYETSVGTAITNLGVTNVFDMDLISSLQTNEYVRNIEPIIAKDGTLYRLLLAHSWQIKQLEDDSNFKSLANSAFVQQMAKDNPYIAGAKYFVHGFAIFENDTAVWPLTTASGLPVYGPSTVTNLSSFETYSTGTKFGAMILGQNALAYSQGSGMRFVGESDDYGARVGLGYEIIDGAARNDFFNHDDGTLGEAKKLINQSSAIVGTYSPNPGF
jgi:hypothetical protein